MTNPSLHSKTVLLLAYYYGKKKSKRVGRPPGGHSNLEGGVKRRGRRRKRRKQLFVHKKRRSSASVDNTPAGSPQVHTDMLAFSLLSTIINSGCVALLLKNAVKIFQTPVNCLSLCITHKFDKENGPKTVARVCVVLVTQGSGEEEDLDEDDSLSEDSGSELQDDLQDDSEQSVEKSRPTTPSPSPPATPRPTRRRRKPCSPSFSDDENHPPSPKVRKCTTNKNLIQQ